MSGERDGYSDAHRETRRLLAAAAAAAPAHARPMNTQQLLENIRARFSPPPAVFRWSVGSFTLTLTKRKPA